MKKQVFILLLGLLLSPLAIGQIHIYSNTTWSNLSLSQDVYIHSGATLTISGNMVFTPGRRIHVHDGGRLVGSNGKLTCLQSFPGTDFWKGIIVDQTSAISPTSSWAVNLTNFTVEYADAGIFCEAGGSNNQTRMIYLNTVTFEKNKIHVQVYNYSTYSSTPSLVYTNVFMNGCQFFDGEAINPWPVHIVGVKTMTVINSGFYMNEPQIQLHLNRMVNSYIAGNTFDSECPYHLAYHGENYNNQLNNNEFIMLNSVYSNSAAVDLGFINSSKQEKFTISNNSFYSSTLVSGRWGIGSEQANSEFDDVHIKDNTFTRMGRGIYLNHMNSENTIEKNNFVECSAAIGFWDDNPGVDISCNTFSDNDIDILIYSGGTLQDQTPGYDPNNSFSSVNPFNYNIVNQGSVNFYYQYLTSPPNIYTGTGQNVFLLGAPYTLSCGGDSRKTPVASDEIETSKDISLTIYPNPAESFVKYSIENASIDQILILNSLGQTVFSEEISASGGRLDISDLSKGTYICVFLNEGFVVEREQLIIK